MANQPCNAEEQEFMTTTGLDPAVVPAPLPADRQARIAGKARQKLGLATAPAPSIAAARAKRPRWPGWATAAVAVAAAFALVLLPLISQVDVALAMEQAVANLLSYHGQVEVQWYEADGTPVSPVPGRSELWEQGERYRWLTHNYDDKGDVVTDIWFVSDGDRQWTIDTRAKQVVEGLAIDSVRLRENLGVKELARLVLRSPHKVVGEESVAGRRAYKFEVTTPQGLVNQVWVDTETHLPLKAVEWHGARLQKVITYTQMEVNPALDPSLFTVQPPADYQVDRLPGQWVDSLETAAAVAGFQPIAPGEKPLRIAAWESNIALVYDGALLYQQAQPSPLGTHDSFVELVGQAGGGPLVVRRDGEGMAWNQSGLSLSVHGKDPARIQAIARSVAPDFALPAATADLVSGAQVRVMVNPDTARQVQAEADKNGAPALAHLSPANAAHAWLEQEFGPTAYKHDPYGPSELTVSAMSAAEAVVEVPAGQVSRVYVKRVAAPRSDGAWFVVGYDKR